MFFRLEFDEHVRGKKAKNVHKAIPVDTKGTNAENYGINIGGDKGRHYFAFLAWLSLRKCTWRTDTAAGVMPDIREAWPSEMGLIRVSFSTTSFESPERLL